MRSLPISRRQSAASIANLLNPVEEPGLPSMATPMPSPTVFAQGPGVAAESFSGEPHHQRCLLTAPARPRSALPPPGQGRLSPAWVAPPRSLSANPDAFGMQPGSSSSMKRAREDDHGGDERNPKHSRGPREGLAGGTNRIPSMPPTLDAYNVIRASRRLPTPAYTTASSNQSGAPSRSSSRGGVQMPVPVHPASTQYQHLATHDASLPSRSTPLRDIPELEPPDNEPSSYDRRASPLLVRAPLARSPLDSHKEAEDFTSDGEEVEAELNCGS
ncbi:hypothetical protein OE88DRAFT_1680446 [Heliocybe sulcata]|uniref:Uncharacterized protein n=1 Tax=Heliocybe sulcata TaxID=5364 RepID=A0A5C3N2S3_9AGAM|nr:hypothetical protein OE88DRAFT_1680446 [Heliocybe sulcata]